MNSEERFDIYSANLRRFIAESASLPTFLIFSRASKAGYYIQFFRHLPESEEFLCEVANHGVWDKEEPYLTPEQWSKLEEKGFVAETREFNPGQDVSKWQVDEIASFIEWGFLEIFGCPDHYDVDVTLDHY